MKAIQIIPNRSVKVAVILVVDVAMDLEDVTAIIYSMTSTRG